MDTSMEAAATLRHRAPNEFTAILAAAAPRTTITSFFYGFSPLTGTGTTGDMSATATPTAGTGTGEAPEALAVTPNAPATGPEARRQHPSRQSLRLPQAATPCHAARRESRVAGRRRRSPLHGASEEGHDNHGRLELKPPDFEVPEYCVGPHRKRCLLDRRVCAICSRGWEGLQMNCRLEFCRQGAGNFRQGKAGMVASCIKNRPHIH